MVIVMRREVAKMLINDPDIQKRLNQAGTWDEAFKILAEEAKKKGVKVKCLKNLT